MVTTITENESKITENLLQEEKIKSRYKKKDRQKETKPWSSEKSTNQTLSQRGTYRERK